MSSANCLRKDADELLRLAMLSESENVKRILTSEATKLVQVAEAEEKINKGAQQKVVPRPLNRPTATSTKLYNYGWDQSDKFVKLYVTLNGVHTFPAESTNVQFTERSFELQVLDEAKKVNYVLTINSLLNEIVPSGSYSKVKTDMVVLFLKKAASQNWPYVTAAEKKAVDAKTPKLDKEEDSGASLMNLMKQMYNDGDDEMKRTIAKAWTESRDKKAPEDML